MAFDITTTSVTGELDHFKRFKQCSILSSCAKSFVIDLFRLSRQYCTRYLYRMRKALNFTHSKGKGFQAKEVADDTLNDARYECLIPAKAFVPND